MFEGITGRKKLGALVQLGSRLLPMAVRGVIRKPFLASSRGLLFIGRGVRLSNPSHIHHSGRLVIEDGVELQGLSKHGIRFGSDVSIGAQTMIRPSSYYGGEIGEGLVIGDRSSVASGCFLGCSGLISIGNDVMFGPGVRVFSENHVFADTHRTIKSQGVERSTVMIGDDCWIGSGTTITANVKIGRGVVVGAGSVVTQDLPDYSIAAGSPAKVIRSRLGDETNQIVDPSSGKVTDGSP
ncbi:MAG: acyltransferase [Microthrixaceae bacterium]|jgi:acetyltransferase-like isoleucine patch superfamily enzyme